MNASVVTIGNNMIYLKILFSLLVVAVLTSCGGGGGSSSATNATPTATDDHYTLDTDEPISGDLGVNDTLSSDGGNVWALATDPVEKGASATVNNDGRFTYYPAPGFVGTDSFTYTLTDVDGDSDSATVTLVISPIIALNDPLMSDQWYLENTGQTTITGSGSSGADIGAMGVLIGTDRYAQGYTGNGIEIAIIDTGLEIMHPDLSSNVVLNGSYNFSYPNNSKGLFDPTATNTDGDHGTGVAGLAGARGGNGLGIWGVAPSVEMKGFNFLVTQEFNEELASLGYKPSADTFTGLSSTEVDIFNKSYGRNPDIIPTGSELAYYDSLTGAMEWGTNNLRSSKGAIYVKAGGNEFDGGSAFTTARCQQAIDNNITCYNVNMETEHATPFQMVVGAFNAGDVRSSFSNTGSATWLVAPGGEAPGVALPSILTTDQSSCSSGYSSTTTIYSSSDFDRGVDPLNATCDYFSLFNGTSAATPIVSGAVALLLEAHPNLNWREVKHILASTARQLDAGLTAKTLSVNGTPVILEDGWVTNMAGYKYSNEYGFGAVNVDAAMTMALQWKIDSTTLPALQTVTKGPFVLSTSNNIPDNSASGLTETTSVIQTHIAESVALTLTVEGLDSNTNGSTSHNIDISDYQIILRSPAGTESILLTPFNAYQAHYDMTDLTLISHAFYGEAIDGSWTLIIRDLDNVVDGAGLGKLAKWSLKFYGH